MSGESKGSGRAWKSCEDDVMARRPIVVTVVAGLVLAIGTASVLAQRRGVGRFGRQISELPNAPYDGQFTFVRVKYEPTPDGYWYGGIPAWAHGYPISEQNLMKIMNEISYLGAHEQEVNAITFDDPELCKYPIAYVIEPDWWAMTDSEAAAIRTYMQKGGFVIVDDFKVRGFRGGGGEGFGGGGWDTFLAEMKRVVPDGRFVELTDAHPIFHSFFEITSVQNFPQAYIPGRPVFYGLFEDNDPSKRLTMVVNYNTDISQYWEWSGRGLRPFDDTNEAYKLGVNYVIYGLTH
jgi:Domain of unknown function (DUF4159)